MDRSRLALAALVALAIVALFALATSLAACMGTDGGPPSGAGPAFASDASTDADGAKVDAAPPSEDDRGEGYVHARGCVRCHQSTDSADGVLSGSSTPRPGALAYPKNLTPDSETGIGDWSDRLILRAIREGVDADGALLCATMPRYAEMDDDEGAAIVAYLRALAPVHHVIPESRCGGDRGEADAGANDAASVDAAADAPDSSDAGSDAGHDAGPVVCVGLAGPGTKASCHACGTRPCQANGCYGGWVCDTRTNLCQTFPIGCTVL